MIQYIKITCLFFILCSYSGWAQTNIFDCNNSRKFATYLFNTNQFELAQHELERISFFCENDSASQLILLKSYRKLSNFQQANLFFDTKTVEEIKLLNTEYKDEYIRLLMRQQRYNEVQQCLKKGLTIKENNEHLLATQLLQKKWNTAYETSLELNAIRNFKINGLKQVAEKSYNSKRKKPWLATMMSVIIPGSGKAYSGYWGDGIVSFLFTASSGYFAYRAFNKYGNNKVYPYIVGGLAVSYYAANIYGGNRAAVHYNDNLDHQFIHETEQILYSNY